MLELPKVLKFLEHFSVITVGSNKVPNFRWADQQHTKLSEQELTDRYKYRGGRMKSDGTEMAATENIGIVTGFEDLEVIDVDTKVFSTQHEKDEFWNEYYQTLQDNIVDFEKKFVVYQTKSGGYHILYKTKRVQGNTKIATLKNHKEAVIETRGRGGYVFVYPDNKHAEKNYFEVEYITDLDREILWHVSASYNHHIDPPESPKKSNKIYSDGDVTPWDDFNQKTDIWEVIKNEFFIPPNGQKKNSYLVKRHGADSAHSGYVFKDSGCLYLFSTATIYPAEKLLSPFGAYAYKYHNGDFKEATRDLYEQGYGSRLRKKVESIKPTIPEKIEVEPIDFPIDIFPNEIQYYLKECEQKLDSNLDYMGCSMIWLISVCVGNSFEVEVKRGWNEKAVVWISVVGKAGIGKTPSIDNVIYPLQKANNREVKKYIGKMEEFRYYSGLSKKEKEEYPEVTEPKKTQFIANDITLEALVELHQESDNAVGVFKDELAGWLKDMNKYRAGSDLEFWLSCWSGKSVSMNRKTARSSFVDKPFIPVLGGIQPSILNNLSTEENKENGFIDRMLFSFPDAKVEHYNDAELDYNTINWYRETIIMFYEDVKKAIKRNEDGEIEPIKSRFSPEAKTEWVRMFNDISNHQNDDGENEYLKSMYPKQKSYIPRFALLIHIFKCAFENSMEYRTINKDSILKAEKLSKYFIMNAKKIKIENTEIRDLKNSMRKGETTFDKLQAIYETNPNFNRSKVAELLGVSRRMIQKHLKRLEDEV